MRRFVLAAALAILVLPSTQVLAAKKFIPLGHSDLEQTANLPPFGSEIADFNLQADIYETNIYWRKREARETDSYMQRFRTAPDANPANRYIDY